MSTMEEEPRFEVTPPGARPLLPQLAPPPTAPAPAPPEPAGDPENAGRQLAQQMLELGYHPVVIFGSTSSGKSTLLGSLLSYMQRDSAAGVEISFGDEFMISGSEYGKSAHEKASAFFFRGVQDHINARMQAATRTEFPFFIPVVLRPGGDLPPVKLALLESNGEWYNPDLDTDRFFRKMRAEIAGLLRNFSGGVSFLHLAPVTQIEQYRETQDDDRSKNGALLRAADLALVGCFNAYRDIRPTKHSDRHLLLVTKWDGHVKPEHASGKFSAPDLADVKDVARNRYPQAYAAFVNLSGGGAGSKQIMQYCSGIISGREMLAQPPEIEAQLRRYPRALWNWIYRGATSDRPNLRPLYTEPTPPPPTFWQRLVARIDRLFGV